MNPFGLCWDDRGNLFGADCHSSPIYQLLRGAYYPSFGKPHDGLGFAPQTITHSHRSTAICAPIYVCDPAWPAELQDHMFAGNVLTAANLIRTLKLPGFDAALSKVAWSSAADSDTRAAAARALLASDAAKTIPQLAAIVTDAAASAPLREKFTAALGDTKSPVAIAAIS